MSIKYYLPLSLDSALEKLEEPNSTLLAGGSDLLLKIRQGKALPNLLIDITRLKELKSIIREEEKLFIGAGITMSELRQSPVIKENMPALAKACGSVGSRQIRNMATLGGNIANGSPAADTVPVLLVYKAEVVLESRQGGRTLPLAEFLTGPGLTALKQGEVLTKIMVPLTEKPVKDSFQKISLRAGMDVALVNGAASISAEGKLRAALGGVAPTAVRLKNVEQLLNQKNSTAADANNTATEGELNAALGQDISPITDLRATKNYREELSAVLLKRMLSRLRRGGK